LHRRSLLSLLDHVSDFVPDQPPESGGSRCQWPGAIPMSLPAADPRAYRRSRGGRGVRPHWRQIDPSPPLEIALQRRRQAAMRRQRGGGRKACAYRLGSEDVGSALLAVATLRRRPAEASGEIARAAAQADGH
jgi:hypothetical protein